MEDIDREADAEDLGGARRERSLHKVVHLLEIGRFEAAEHEVRALLAEAPEDPSLLALLARIEVDQGHSEDGLATALEALARDAQDVEALHVAADASAALGRNTEAERHFLEALALDPVDAGLLFGYANLMFKTGKLDKAERLAQRVLALSPESAGAHQLASLVAARRREGREARSRGQQGLARAPDESVSHLVQGHACLASGRPFAARRHLRAAVSADPANQTVREAFEEADRACRVVYLPAYYLSLVFDRVPGSNFILWGVFLVMMFVMERAGVPENVAMPIVLAYVGLCIYSWVAEPIVKLWVKILPPR